LPDALFLSFRQKDDNQATFWLQSGDCLFAAPNSGGRRVVIKRFDEIDLLKQFFWLA
jgi:hypothetical protein